MQILNIGQKNKRHDYRKKKLGRTIFGWSAYKKNLEVLMDHKLNWAKSVMQLGGKKQKQS